MTDHVRDVLEAADKCPDTVPGTAEDGLAIRIMCEKVLEFRAAGGLEAYDRERAGEPMPGDETYLGRCARCAGEFQINRVDNMCVDCSPRYPHPTPPAALAVVREKILRVETAHKRWILSKQALPTEEMLEALSDLYNEGADRVGSRARCVEGVIRDGSPWSRLRIIALDDDIEPGTAVTVVIPEGE